MSLRYLPLFLAACVLATQAGCVSSPERLGQHRAAIINGRPDTEHTAVGLLLHDSETNPDDDSACSATLIAADLVLTAAHCVTSTSGTSEGAPYRELSPIYFFVGKNASLDPQSGAPAGDPHLVKGIAFHNAYAGAALSDVAVVRIAPPVAPEIATPMILAREAPQVGQQMTLVGFGVTKSGDVDTMGVRRRATNFVSSIEATTFTFSDENAETGSGCAGDSGGPTLATEAGATVIAGVQAAVPDSSCAATIDMRVDLYRSWIENQMALLEGKAAPNPIDPGAPAGGEYGASCTSGAACKSHVCITVRSLFKKRQVCSRTCNANAPCPTGDECHSSGFCLASHSKADGEIQSVERLVDPPPEMAGGCSVGDLGASGDESPLFTLALLLLLGLLVTRRRR